MLFCLLGHESMLGNDRHAKIISFQQKYPGAGSWLPN